MNRATAFSVRPSARDDAASMRALAQGDLGALGALYDAHGARVRGFLAKMTGSRAEADDLTHETFLTAMRVAGGFDGRASALPFLLGIAAKLVTRARHGVLRTARLRLVFEQTLPARDGARTPEDLAAARDDLAAFASALARLTDDKRAVFLLVEREGMTCEEVAASLAIPIGTVWTRLHHARAELRARLKKRGVG